MPKISEEAHAKKISFIAGMAKERRFWESVWREISDFYLPRRYVWLLTAQERAKRSINNPRIVDGTGTTAARILASGMMNGITSPSRPWFRLGLVGFEDDANSEERIWLDEVQRRMMLVMAESNFYNALAVLYLDLVLFGTAACLIYEDEESVIRCYNPALGEYWIGQSPRLQVDKFAREFTYTVTQTRAAFGEENLSDSLRSALRQGGAQLLNDVTITHLIEPATDDPSYAARSFTYRECFWETKGQKGTLLAERGFHEFPGIVVRWELTGNDSYGSSPAMDALGDVKQLQQISIEKGKSLAILNTPPLLADIQLQHKPSAFFPKGVTFVSGLNNGNGAGARPVYQINPPIQEMTLDIRDIQARIREIFNNDLFQMISQLDTVRTATEIDARREEKLIRLGSVLERFENEALDPAIKRIFSIMQRGGLLPDPPARMEGADIEIQYDSILSVAQSAVSAAPTERFVAFVGQIGAAVYPKALNIPNWESLIRDYGRDIGVPAKNINPPEVTQRMNEAQDSLAQEREAAAQGTVLAEGAKTLSETDVGGGANALQQLLG